MIQNIFLIILFSSLIFGCATEPVKPYTWKDATSFNYVYLDIYVQDKNYQYKSYNIKVNNMYLGSLGIIDKANIESLYLRINLNPGVHEIKITPGGSNEIISSQRSNKKQKSVTKIIYLKKEDIGKIYRVRFDPNLSKIFMETK